MTATHVRTRTTTASAVKARALDRHLTFRVEAETFAIPISQIREVLQFEKANPIPLAPDFVRGVIHRQGKSVPIIDLAVRFHHPPIDVGRRSCAVILEIKREGKTTTIGVLVDQVHEVLGIDPTSIERAPSFEGPGHTEFMRGVSNQNGRFIVVLDVAHLLSPDELVALERTRD